MNLYIVRHGQTEYNEKHLYCGRVDAPLSESGLSQLPALAEKARALKLDAIISSPLSRALSTADAIASACGLKVRTDDRLIERSFGDYEGKYFDIDGGEAVYWHNFGVRYPNGESFFEVVQRVYNCLDDICDIYAGQNVMIVAHGVVCRAVVTYARDITDEDFFRLDYDNCEIMKFEI